MIAKGGHQLVILRGELVLTVSSVLHCMSAVEVYNLGKSWIVLRLVFWIEIAKDPCCVSKRHERLDNQIIKVSSEDRMPSFLVRSEDIG